MRIGKTLLALAPVIILLSSCATTSNSARAGSFPEQQIRLAAGEIEDAVLYINSTEPSAADFKVNERTGETAGEFQPMDVVVGLDRIAEKTPSLPQGDNEAALSLIRNRILRRSTIYELEKRGCVGENSRGYLENLKAEACSGDRDERDRVAYIVLVENRDRRSLYEEIIKTFGLRNSDADRIQQIFAEQIHRKAWAGTPLEASGGGWEKK